MYFYQPNPILLPKHLDLSREFPRIQSFKEKVKCLDTKTIFFDVFLDRYTRQLRAIGPHPLNLKSILYPLTLIIENKVVRHRIDVIERLVFLESAPLPDSLPITIKVTLKFKQFEQNITIKWYEVEQQISQIDGNKLTISTLQKDNHFTWIGDWIRWHKRLYGVQRLVFYDNGSTNREKLIQFLHSLDSEIDIIFIDWPFPYGILPFQFAQHGSLNHVRLRFGIEGGYCINLDIDEYLVVPISENLLDYLARQFNSSKVGAVIFKEFIVPNIVDSDIRHTLRCFDFSYRYRNAGFLQKNGLMDNQARKKYIFQFDRIGYCSVHGTSSWKNRQYLKRYGLSHSLRFLAERIIYEFTHKYRRNRPNRPRIDAVNVLETELFFFHFMGLSASKKRTFTKIEYDKNVHVKEPLIEKLSRKAGLIDESLKST